MLHRSTILSKMKFLFFVFFFLFLFSFSFVLLSFLLNEKNRKIALNVNKFARAQCC